MGPEGEERLQALVDEMKAGGRGKQFDCILGVSGGCDSSFLAHEMVRRGVRPLAVHFDNTWNSPIATNNIYTVLDQLDVPLETFVVANHEYDHIYRAFIESGVRDIEAPTDIGFMVNFLVPPGRLGEIAVPLYELGASRAPRALPLHELIDLGQGHGG